MVLGNFCKTVLCLPPTPRLRTTVLEPFLIQTKHDKPEDMEKSKRRLQSRESLGVILNWSMMIMRKQMVLTNREVMKRLMIPTT